MSIGVQRGYNTAVAPSGSSVFSAADGADGAENDAACPTAGKDDDKARGVRRIRKPPWSFAHRYKPYAKHFTGLPGDTGRPAAFAGSVPVWEKKYAA